MAALGSFDTYAGYYAQLINDQTPPEPAFMREFYRVLFAYYQQNGLYDYLNQELRAVKTSNQSVKPIRNPAWRVVEFYASKLFPGTLPDALPIETDNQQIISPIELVWNWSNFSSTKQKWARWFAIFGDWFIKISTKGDPVSSVYMSIIKPEYVTDMTLDERGFLTYIRIDVPIQDDDDPEVDRYHTEVWDKKTQIMTVWNHKAGLDKKLSELPPPVSEATFSDLHGDDFIPIVYQPFRDDGSGRGSGSFAAQLDKIDEANRQATRLAQILFRYNRAIWASTSSGKDASGRPLPPISFEDLSSDGAITIGDDQILSLPGASNLQPLVPNINYGDALKVLESHMQELTKDLPELGFYELRTMRDISGRAVRFLMDDMISRVVEARGNAEAAIIRAQQIALTVGKNVGIDEFQDIGDFRSGDFEHSFSERTILPEDKVEMSELIRNFSQAGATIFGAAKAAGMNDEQARELADVGFFEGQIISDNRVNLNQGTEEPVVTEQESEGG